MPTNEDLQAQLRELTLEVRSLRDEVERLKGGEAAASAAPAAARDGDLFAARLLRSLKRDPAKAP